MRWTQSLRGAVGQEIAALEVVVSAWAVENGLTLGQVQPKKAGRGNDFKPASLSQPEAI